MKIRLLLLLLFAAHFCKSQSIPLKPNAGNKIGNAAIDCTNWLSTPSYNSFAEVGQINITGNQITVEATINRTAPYSGGLLYAGEVVSKHASPLDANYLLRPNTAEITTNVGYFRTPDICEIELNKTYHVAMVYDGATLKFYRNGFLMSQVAASGNLFQNTWKTEIGFYDLKFVNTQFLGYINEVRIWNVARAQADIRSYMNSSLPSPTTQAGLVAYYTFDNLLNKQGNPAYNAVLNGAATINSATPHVHLLKTPAIQSSIRQPPLYHPAFPYQTQYVLILRYQLPIHQPMQVLLPGVFARQKQTLRRLQLTWGISAMLLRNLHPSITQKTMEIILLL